MPQVSCFGSGLNISICFKYIKGSSSGYWYIFLWFFQMFEVLSVWCPFCLRMIFHESWAAWFGRWPAVTALAVLCCSGEIHGQWTSLAHVCWLNFERTCIFWITWLCLNHYEWYRFESNPMIAYEWRDEHWEQPAVSIYDIQNNKASVLIYSNFWLRQPVVDFSVIRCNTAIFSGFQLLPIGELFPLSDHRSWDLTHEIWSTWYHQSVGPEMSRVNYQFIWLFSSPTVATVLLIWTHISYTHMVQYSKL